MVELPDRPGRQAVSEPTLETQIHRIQMQLGNWNDNLATRVAGEAQALSDEISKLADQDDVEAVEALVQRAHDQIMTSCDLLRDLRRRLQDLPKP